MAIPPPAQGWWFPCRKDHEKWKIKNKMINVGVDVWDFFPVSEAQIVKIMQDISNNDIY